MPSGPLVRRTRTWLLPRFGPVLPIVGLLVVLVGVDLVWARDYGESWDMGRAARLGVATLRSYLTGVAPSAQDHLGDMDRHGPAVVALVEWIRGGLPFERNGWEDYQTRYFILFLWFVLAVLLMYLLGRRLLSRPAAALGAALFASQPVLFGHGFINPFDGPFMALFAAAVLAGLVTIDNLDRVPTSSSDAPVASPSWRDLWWDWVHAGPTSRRRLVIWAALLLAAALELLVLRGLAYPTLNQWTRAAYEGRAWRPVNDLFRWIAEDATRAPWEAYAERVEIVYSRARWVVLAALSLPVLVAARRTLPSFWREQSWPKALLWAALGGTVLGAATAVRLVAPLAGVLVSLAILARAKYRAITPLLVYWAMAATVCYIAWPSLWTSPWESLRRFIAETSLESFDVQVLFEGRLLKAADLPPYFAASFIGLQTTIPALLLALGGLVLAFRDRGLPQRRLEFGLHALWFVVPFLAAGALGSTAYDNGRHFHFARVPLFLFAGIGIEDLWARLKRPYLRAGLAAIVLLPGIVGIVRLHPYEYIYYNELAGGVTGAYRRYELDYWASSYRETLAYLNAVAPAGATVEVGVARELFSRHARPDLLLYPQNPEEGATVRNPDFAMSTTRANRDLELRPNSPVVFWVERDGALLAIVRDVGEAH